MLKWWRYYLIYKSFKNEGHDLLRGAAGGLIFGTPILFTMEMWFHGLYYAPAHLLGLLLFITFLNTSFSYSSGLRRHNKDHTLRGAVADGVTALALGVVIAVCVLALIGQLDAAEGLSSMIGKVVIEAAAISFGITFTNSRFPRRQGTSQNDHEYRRLEKAWLSREQKQARLDFHNLAAVLGGAAIFSFNVAPTEEITMVAAGLGPGRLLLLVLAECAVCYLILYAAQFKEKKVFKKTPLQSPAAEVVMTVAAAWVMAGMLLALLGEAAVLDSHATFLAGMVTLGFPAVVGGAAGKVVV